MTMTTLRAAHAPIVEMALTQVRSWTAKEVAAPLIDRPDLRRPGHQCLGQQPGHRDVHEQHRGTSSRQYQTDRNGQGEGTSEG